MGSPAEPADENDSPVYEGRMNMGAISLHFPMILQKAKTALKEQGKENDLDAVKELLALIC